MNHRVQSVLVTRRRWDALMIPIFLVAAVAGFFCVWQTGKLRFAVAPVAVIPPWIIFRRLIPISGTLTPTIRSTPGAVLMLWFGLAGLMSMIVISIIDVLVFRHPFRAPLEPYHALLFAPPFIIMFVGAFFVDRIQKQHKLTNGDLQDLQDTAHEEPSTNNPMNPSGGSGES